ncbi:hypothetical protein BC829DRAFT_408660 [Chytridium lagenaria]|nr:hypothetical protein BC829DRAFT_408660 [Chytridium lagenaria]
MEVQSEVKEFTTTRTSTTKKHLIPRTGEAIARNQELEHLRQETARLQPSRKSIGKYSRKKNHLRKRGTDDRGAWEERIAELESMQEALQRKLHILVENNEMKQRIIMEFEHKMTSESFGFDSKHMAVLREFQAHRLQELYKKSRRHLELERRQNETLRKTLVEAHDATLVESLRSELTKVKDELRTTRRENQALKLIQHQHEREILQLTESNYKVQMEEYAEEMGRLKIQLARMEDEERHRRVQAVLPQHHYHHPAPHTVAKHLGAHAQ